jgi:hypothetical protein
MISLTSDQKSGATIKAAIGSATERLSRHDRLIRQEWLQSLVAARRAHKRSGSKQGRLPLSGALNVKVKSVCKAKCESLFAVSGLCVTAPQPGALANGINTVLSIIQNAHINRKWNRERRLNFSRRFHLTAADKQSLARRKTL